MPGSGADWHRSVAEGAISTQRPRGAGLRVLGVVERTDHPRSMKPRAVRSQQKLAPCRFTGRPLGYDGLRHSISRRGMKLPTRRFALVLTQASAFFPAISGAQRANVEKLARRVDSFARRVAVLERRLAAVEVPNAAAATPQKASAGNLNRLGY
jgi:hypothetical protein